MSTTLLMNYRGEVESDDLGKTLSGGLPSCLTEAWNWNPQVATWNSIQGNGKGGMETEHLPDVLSYLSEKFSS